jgi:CRP-like cAMP-binding protein
MRAAPKTKSARAPGERVEDRVDPWKGRGPAIRAVPLMSADNITIQLLSPKQRQQLLSISTRVHFKKGQVIYRRGATGAWLYFCQEGIVKTYQDLPSGTRRITAFLFPFDMFGLAEAGRYVNAAQAVTPVSCYRVEKEVLSAILQQDAALEFQFLCKLTHELRKGQRRAMMLGRRDTVGRLAMFLLMMRHHVPDGVAANVIPLPMSRSDIAGFLGQSLESISRATAELSRRGLVQFNGRSAARVLDIPGLERLAADL